MVTAVQGNVKSGDRPGARAAAVRLAVVGLLAVLVVLGLHTEVAGPTWDTARRGFDAEVAGAVDGAATLLLVALLARSHRAPTEQALLLRLRTALVYLLGMAVAALSVTVVLLLVNLPITEPKGAKVPGRLGAPRSHKLGRLPPGHAAPGGLPLLDILYGVLAALVLVAVVALAWRLQHYASGRQEPEPEVPAQEYETVLEGAVAGARRALLRLDDARAAIIACYLAMEQSLAEAGSARLSTETPDELLAKAAGGLGGAGTGAARRLTALFYEARFSTHSMDAACRGDAEAALATLAGELGSRRVLSSGARQ